MILAEANATGEVFSLPQLWLIIAVALCLPVCIAVFVRIGRWWITDRPVPLPIDGALSAVPLPLWTGLLLFLGTQTLVVAIVLGYDAAADAALLPWEPLPVPDVFRPGLFIAQTVPVLVAFAILRGFGRWTPATVGVRAGDLGAGLAHGVVAFAAILPVCVAALMVNVVLLHLLKTPVTPHPVLEAILKTPDLWAFAFAGLMAVVIAPLAEEFLYRGILLMTLVRHVGIVPALVVSSAVFAAAHFTAEPQALLPLFFLGMALGYIAYRTRSLVAPIIAHALFNGLMIFGTFFGS